MTTPCTLTVWPTYGDANVLPFAVSGTEPCTAPIGSVTGAAFTVTVSAQVVLCGVASLFVARTCTEYVPAVAELETLSVAVAVPPDAEAGVTLSIVIALDVGDTESSAIDVTVPSASVAETCCDAAVPAVVVTFAPQLAVTG